MTSAAPIGKKPALCRYFMSSGSCVYGEDCQFLHQSPVAFQQNFQNTFLNGPPQHNGPIALPDNPELTEPPLGTNNPPPGSNIPPLRGSNPPLEGNNAVLAGGNPPLGGSNEPFFPPGFSGGDTGLSDQFQPFSRSRPVSRNIRNGSLGGLPGSSNPGNLMNNSPLSQNNSPMSQANQLPSPFNSSMTPNKAPISQSTPLSQQHMTNMPPQNGPISVINGQMPPNMKQFVTGGSGFDSSIANDFSALNLSVPPSTKGANPQGSNPSLMTEFISSKLSHSSSSPNFTNFNMQPPGPPPVPTTSTNHLGGISINSNASPNHSPRLSPAGSPLMMRRTGSPATPLRQGTSGTNKAGSSSTIQENVGGTTYFYNAEDFTPQREGIQLPNFSMYQGQPAHIAHMKVKSNMPQFFMPDELKMEILNRNALTMAHIDLGQNIDIPSEVDTYRNLFPLEPPNDNPHHKSKTFGYPTTCYKALNTKDGLTYCLRRIHGFRLVNTKCMTLVDMWKKMYHPNIVQLREVFTTKAFGDHSIVFVYDFFPGAETLLTRHFSQASSQINGFSSLFNLEGSARPFSSGKGSTGPRQHAGLLPESLIWAYVVQLSSSLRAIHAAGLSCRTLDPSKIIIYSKSRLRLNCCGIFDVLTYDNNQSNPMALTPHYQQEDLISLGKVVLALACNSVMAIQRENLQTSMELVARNYSADLKNLILYLLGNQNRPRSINDIMPMIGARFYTQLDSAQLRSDVIQNEMAKEVENGRLFRLMTKLAVMTERPEFNLDPQWSETGDRYMIKLFRDYVFHQVDENGAPWIDMSHIIQCLNKLDSGSSDKISLMSRDEQNILVVSYAEIKQCVENAFGDILSAANQSSLS